MPLLLAAIACHDDSTPTRPEALYVKPTTYPPPPPGTPPATPPPPGAPAPTPGSTPPPTTPVTWTVHVFVATTGADLDADGYTVVLSPDPGEILFTYTDTVSSNDSTEFTIQGSGSYYPSLSGIAPNCTPTRYADPVVLTEAGGRIDVALAVQCFAPPAGQGIRVATVLTGIYDVNAPTTLVVQSDTASTGPFFLQSYLLRSGETRLVPLPVGQFHAFVWRPDCAVQPANDLPASVQANRATDVTFTLTCVPPGTAP